jgi:hypothetical protein
MGYFLHEIFALDGLAQEAVRFLLHHSLFAVPDAWHRNKQQHYFQPFGGTRSPLA